jgi:hypothetical protein
MVDTFHLGGPCMQYSMMTRALKASLISLVAIIPVASPPVQAEQSQASINPASVVPISIENDSGGYIIDYAIRFAEYEKNDEKIQFAGRCDSACTMFLALPKKQTCISPGAFFRFHSPYGGSAKQDEIASSFLLEKYPQWVTKWIAANGHLTDDLITMDFAYAKKFMNVCAQTVASF